MMKEAEIPAGSDTPWRLHFPSIKIQRSTRLQARISRPRHDYHSVILPFGPELEIGASLEPGAWELGFAVTI